MSSGTALRPSGSRVAGSETPTGPGGTLTGAGVLLSVALRRDRVRLPIWILAATAMVVIQAVQSQEVYGTAAALEAYRLAVESNAAVVIFAGPPVGLDSIPGIVVFEIWTTVALIVALMNVFTVGRHTRADEEAGRTELLRAGCVGRHAPFAAAVATAVVADLALVVVLTAGAVAIGLPFAGSLLLGVALAVLGLVFATLTAVAAQVFEHARAVYGSVSAVLGASLVLRAAGDVGDGTLSWASPMGWVQATHPYSGDRWWPLLPALLAAALLLLLARALVDHRDVGAGLVATRLGPAEAGRGLAGPGGLALRLHRAALTGWAAGLLLYGAFMGLMVQAIEDLAVDNPELVELLGGAENLVDGFLGLGLVMCALLSMGYGIAATLRSRGEETSGRAAPVLATAVSRPRWLGSHLAVALAGTGLLMLLAGTATGVTYALVISDAEQVPRLAVASLTYVPAVWIVVGVVAALLGVLPRAAAPLGWGLLAYVFVIGLMADSFGWGDGPRALSPLHHTPLVPAEALDTRPAVLLAVAALLVLAGLFGFRRRDVAVG
jgi:ABC-2 type transport system permease protein